ncbi:VOC family protein [Cupriavidus sp. AU9028]|uniref:VOC family protein n=1 Tax=Cupriavidus sp. AU9028 TaxID=2871157 RepID=UPI001C947146|nr:VOC family protein [Cupriavidus sp. AU9028]MBY4898149.1 VOC family protein [Cupriavidus sp. AU9028]
MKIEPYLLFFDGRAEEALDFYQQALGAQVESRMRYSDSPEPVPAEYIPPGGPQKLMHASFLLDGQRVMLSDDVPGQRSGFSGFSLTLQYESEEQVRSVFDKLADGGRVVMPPGATFFSPCYGQLFDRFGVQWMVMVSPEPAAQA